jgi:ATP-dependent Lhr-like helicase
MRALATDTTRAIAETTAALGLPFSVELRTSDTSSSLRARQKDRLPTILVTTPESLTLLLSYPDCRQKLSTLRAVIVDEWHELLSTKRGTQTELALARLRTFNPTLRTWGLSATLSNLQQAAHALLGQTAPSPIENRKSQIANPESPIGNRQSAIGNSPTIISANLQKELKVLSLFPDSIERFPWGGHMGLRMVEPVIRQLDQPGTALVFTNTRAQSEIWFRSLLAARPDWLGQIAIHHGSLDRAVRLQVEALLREGALRAVVCTSSLDLGVDFSAVDRVLQIGSPKGIARLMQRAGRSGHRPGQPSIVHCVPTHALELAEFSAARTGIETRNVESRLPLDKPLDVLAQHIVTVAAGGGFHPDHLLAEVRTTYAYQHLTDQEWQWVLDFAQRGGPTLTAYPRFMRIRQQPDDQSFTIASDSTARLHRLAIGTISADGMMQLVQSNNRKLGSIEESFISRMKPGDTFVFGGRLLELLGTRQMTARVRPAKRRSGSVPSWAGGRFPLSTQLAALVRHRLDQARTGHYPDAEMLALKPILALQSRWSHLPSTTELLIESTSTREGIHLFLFPFLGRLVQEGLGAVLAHRIGQLLTCPVTATYTDYGIELHLPPETKPAAEALTEPSWRSLLSPDHLMDDLLACLNAGELTRRQFREISRVAGLIIVSTPGAPKSTRMLQASSELFYDVFSQFDPDNLLLVQARREVLERQLEFSRLTDALTSLKSQQFILTRPTYLTPLAFPLWAQHIQSQTVKGGSPEDRITRMLAQLEQAAQSQ